MKYAFITALAFAASVMADSGWGNGKNDTVYTTEIVTHLTTYCPSATTLTVNGKTHTITEATTLTITDCPCTITKPITTTRIPTTTGSDTTIYYTTGPASSSEAPPPPPPTAPITPATASTPVSTSRGTTETTHGGEVTTVPTGTGSGTATPVIPANSQYTGAANINQKFGDGLTGLILAGLALVL